MAKRKKQASIQAPWRKQIHLTGRTMLPLIWLLVMGGMYLAVNARLATAGREVLVLQSERAELQRQKDELTANLAALSTPERMLERALALGFRPATSADTEYILVQGYSDPPPFVAPQPPFSNVQHESVLSPAYTETLGEWLLGWVGREGSTK